jgi:hypothetical protein
MKPKRLDLGLTAMDVLADRSFNLRRCGPYPELEAPKSASRNGRSSVLLAPIFDLPAVVYHPVARGERREMIVQVKHAREGEGVVRGLMARFL